MKRHLQKPVTTWGIKPQLQTMDPKVLPAAWIVLRWYVFMVVSEDSADRCVRCVGSCTAHLEELTDPSDLVQGVGTEVTSREVVHC